MKKEDLKDIFKKASKIASVVPEIMQPAAFNRAVELLLGQPPSGEGIKEGGRQTKGRVSKSTRQEKDDIVKNIINKLNRTKYANITKFKKVLDRSLLVLKISQDEFNMGELTPPQIAKILTKKFRLKTSRQAVHMALESAGNLVDRTPLGKAYKYSIMHPGEEHLNKIIKGLAGKSTTKKAATK